MKFKIDPFHILIHRNTLSKKEWNKNDDAFQYSVWCLLLQDQLQVTSVQDIKMQKTKKRKETTYVTIHKLKETRNNGVKNVKVIFLGYNFVYTSIFINSGYVLMYGFWVIVNKIIFYYILMYISFFCPMCLYIICGRVLITIKKYICV